MRSQDEIARAITYREAIGPRAAGAFDFLTAILSPLDTAHAERAVMVGCGWRPTTAMYASPSVPAPPR